MKRGTTPTYNIVFDEGIGEQIADICLAFVQGDNELFLHMSEGDITLNGDTATVTLTQAQTLSFNAGLLKRQVKVKMEDGTVMSSLIEAEGVSDVLHEEEL